MVNRSSASTYHIHIYPLLMNEAEKCGFISCVGIFIMHFSRVSKYPGNHPFLLVMANCHCILDSFPYQLVICNKHIYWDGIGSFGGIKTDNIDLSIACLSHHSQALIWGFTTLSRPNKFTCFHCECHVILVKIHSDMIHKESCALGWCCRAHKARYHRRYLACSFA